MQRYDWVNLWEAPLSVLWGESSTGIFTRDNRFKSLPGCACDHVLYFSENGFMKAHHLREEIERSAVWGKEAHDTPGFIRRYVQEAVDLNTDCKQFVAGLGRGIEDRGPRQLAELYEKYCYFHQASVAYYKLCNDEFQEAVAKELRDHIGARLEDSGQLPDVISELTFPDALNTLDRQELGVLAIAQKMAEKKVSADALTPEFERLVAAHVEKFGWIGTGEGGDFWARDHVLHDLKELGYLLEGELARRIDEKKRKPNLVRSRRHELMDRYELTPRLRNYVEQIIALAETKLELRLGWAYRDYYVLPLIEAIAKRLGIRTDQVGLLRFDEVARALEGSVRIAPELLERRARAFLFMVVDGKLSFYDGEEAIKKFHQEIDEQDFSGSVEVRGSIAKTGFVCGIARLISPLESQGEAIAKVQEGDILITGMTRPHMLPAMKKAAAYVTDEGGITCHAAIIARELGKPCVIATKIATKVFKDGDMIEVDANTGVVRKIT